jgi:hypothetical protein
MGCGMDKGISIAGTGKIFLFWPASRPALRLTQPPIERVLGAIFPGVKRSGREADHSPRSSGAIPLLLQVSL